MKKAKRAIIWTNGMLTVFDMAGEQFCEYQGLASEMLPKLKKDFPDCPVERMDWNRDIRPALTDDWHSEYLKSKAPASVKPSEETR